jgi:tetratricopeptide (TPR) repeat protein
MRSLGIILLLATLTLAATAQTKEQSKECIKFVREGNAAYKRKDYAAAEDLYRHALEKDSLRKEAVFNLGVALQQQKKDDEAMRQYEKAAALLTDKTQKAGAYHNIGNAYCVKKQWEQAIDNFKKALRLAPNDMDTKYNLAYAQSKLAKEQQQQQQQKQRQQQDQQDKKDNKDKQKQPSGGDKDNKDKQQDKQDGNGDKDKDQQKQGKQPGQLSKEEAQKLLDAIKNQENKVQDKMDKKKEKGVVIGGGKDW